ncbi:hypothetical protein ACWIUD_01565 [Helicobacter sp. 23-1044]
MQDLLDCFKKSEIKKMLKYAPLAFMAYGFVGCGGSYAITYNTSPIGANIVCSGVGKGLSPLTLYYDRDGINDDGFLYTEPCKAVYSSGYEESFSNKWNTNQFPNGVQQTLTRPQGKGYKQDVAFGMEHQRTLIMQRQAEMQILLQQQQIQQQQMQYQNQQMQKWLPRQPVTCFTTGNITTCH